MLEKSRVSLFVNLVHFLFSCKNWPPFEKSPKFDLGYYLSDKVISLAIWHFYQKFDLNFEKLI
jgi:hypothetical protein